jgi:hypothetical protein
MKMIYNHNITDEALSIIKNEMITKEFKIGMELNYNKLNN